MNEFEKTQLIRLADVFIIAPFMIWFGITARGISDTLKIAMIILGILTLIYNGRNYLLNLK